MSVAPLICEYTEEVRS